MDNNPYGYDKRVSQQLPQYHTYPGSYPGTYRNQQPGLPQTPRPQQAPPRKAQTPPRMPKDRALALARLFKKSLVVMSLATFASFSGLVAFHQLNTTTSQKSTTTSTSTTTSRSHEEDNGFLNQQGDDNLGNNSATATATASQSSSASSTNSGSSSGSNSSASSGPVSGTSVS